MHPVEVQTQRPSHHALLSLLSNPIILTHTAPYLSPHSLLSLGATCRSFHDLVLHSPTVFQHLDLRHVSSLQFDIDAMDHGGEVWRAVQVDEHLTEDE